MTDSIKHELREHLIDRIIEEIITEENYEEAHHYAFNEDYYIIGYYQAEQWLKKHGMSAFKAIGICQEWERDNFGEVTKEYDNAETTVNMLAYVLGHDVIPNADSWEEFKEELKING